MRINPILKIGSQGVEVEDLQQKLIKINYLKGDADGYFGKNTERAVLNFQADNNLKVDGIVGEDTWNIINKKLNIPIVKKMQTIKQGDQNDDVIDLKIKLKRLGCFSDEINNNFDIKTTESVKKIQIDHNLKADGIVGPNTWKVINSKLEKVLPTIINPLFEGAKGDEIALLQEYLNLLGYYNFKIDGNFNVNTTKAVKLFQKENNLNDTGIVNQETWELMEQKVFDLDKSTRLENLKEGSTGLEVITLQEKLRLVKSYFGSITGSFGPETTEAVKSFQSQNNLSVTGIVDNNTWDVLLNKTSDSFVANTFATPVMQTLATNFETISVLSRPTLRLGDSGQDVKNLQQILTELMYYQGIIDGIFGSSTNIAVRKFQTNNRLTADGIVGRNTWSALIYLYSPLAVCGDTVEDSGLDFVGVVIDPAHGGSDPGAVSSQIIEKDKSLQISKYIANRFKELGVPYYMTRE
ncbi:MAG: peptidoglycan-binding protein, partial [Bacilli bacterium]|nr:peptidoglycan-binding protein [Bacilli bacterium]